MARAFAVRRTSGMEPRMVCHVPRSSLSRAGIREEAVHLGDALRNPRPYRIDRAVGICPHDPPGLALHAHLRSLAAAERPRICSEADVKHGFAGDMPRCAGGFRKRYAPLSPSRRILFGHCQMAHLRTSLQAPHLRQTGRSLPPRTRKTRRDRACQNRPAGYPPVCSQALAHLQWRGRSCVDPWVVSDVARPRLASAGGQGG